MSHTPEKIANASLIAAAPDLLALAILRRLVDDALPMLVAIQWDGPSGGHSICPSCRRWRANGHMPDCALALTIRRMEEAMAHGGRADGNADKIPASKATGAANSPEKE